MSENCTIQVMKTGPLKISGNFQLLDGDGNPIQTGEKIALCRCGHSSNKPFCDASHNKVGFFTQES